MKPWNDRSGRMCEGSESIVENRALGGWSAMTLLRIIPLHLSFEHDLCGKTGIHLSRIMPSKRAGPYRRRGRESR